MYVLNNKEKTMNTSTLTANLTAFYAVADIAATKWYQAKCSYFRSPSWQDAEQNRRKDDKAFTFRNPNFDHTRGYIAFLFYIANRVGGCKRRELCEAFKLKSVSFTVDTLRRAGLIELDTEYTHKFTVTLFGRAYLALAELARPDLKALKDAKQLLKAAASL